MRGKAGFALLAPGLLAACSMAPDYRPPVPNTRGVQAIDVDLADLVSRVGASGTIAANLEQLFRRMVFNVLVANRDDHLRNHGFLREGNGWILSPAFDVNPNPYKDGHALGVCFEDPAPAAASLLEMRDFFRLSADGARSILDDVRQAVGRWDSVARDEGASRGEIAGMSAVIDPAR